MKEALAEYLEVPAESILGNGGIELIYLLGGYFHSARLVVPVPSFGEYGPVIPVWRRKCPWTGPDFA